MATIPTQLRRRIVLTRGGLFLSLLAVLTMVWSAKASDFTSFNDGRLEFLGRWTCEGTITYGTTPRPYNAKLRYSGDLDNHWLAVDFQEQVDSETQNPVKEKQYWTFTPETNTHTRFLADNSGNYGLVSSPGWDGNLMLWEGFFHLAGTDFHLDERIERVNGSPKIHHWIGVISLSGVYAGMYDLVCTKGH